MVVGCCAIGIPAPGFRLLPYSVRSFSWSVLVTHLLSIATRPGRHAKAAIQVGALLSIAMVCSIGPAAYALTNCDVADETFDGEEQAFLSIINQYRVQNGVGTLTASTNLNRAAAWMAVDLATKNYFSHTDSLGRSPSVRAINCGSPQGVGENIAAGWGQDTAQEIFAQWQASSGHNQNMLYGGYRQIGIARYFNANSTYKWYWVTDFSGINDGTNAGGGSATPVATATPLPASPTSAAIARATISSPQPGSTLPGSTVTFSWTTGTGALEYFLYVGTSPGINNIYAASTGLNRTAIVNSIPTNGSAIYVRLWTRFTTGWQFIDYSYTAAASAPAATSTHTATPAPSRTPTPVSTSTPSSTPTRTATPVASTGTGTATPQTPTTTRTATRTVTPTRTVIPTSTRTVTATPISTSTAAATSTPAPARAQMTSPVPGSTLPGTTATFNWTAGSGAKEYFLFVGTTTGANDIYSASAGLARTATVSNLPRPGPRQGVNVYVRLWTRLTGGWEYFDYVYKAAA
jgi:uncharacterized protein YkwD